MITFAPMNTEIDNILQRVYFLYQKYGIKSITMDDVARELGISKKTIYECFTDKNDLVEKVYEYEHHLKTCQFEEVFTKGENAIQGLFLVIHFMDDMLKEYNASVDYDLKKYYPEVFEKKRKRMIEGVYDKIHKNLIRGIEEKVYRSDMDPELIARLHVSRIMSVMTSDIFTVEEFTSNNNRRELMIYHIRGIATEKGIKVLEKELQNEKEIEK
jgi:TetR/AcrR family transcriptional regulator, cholesterol catabolism regulator